ncbi:MAG: ThiF family adenylyltransferase [Nanoarchaeota archaeon]|nr:ThiF family adenylyltransferase [Nanoarchaeota archaeon]
MRYLKQIIFERIGKQGQKYLKSSKVTIIGLGALGTRSSELLARAGIGNLILIDRDIVELSNLQRQTLFTENDINKPKALIAKEHLEKINSNIKIKAIFKDINFKNIESNVKGDLILDCTDNLETRFLINEFSIENNIPWIFTSVVGSSGMLFNFIPKKTPCFKCIFPEPETTLETCDTEGIINTTASLMSSMQVTEAFKILTRQSCLKELIHYDLWKNKLTKIKVKTLTNCNSCNKKDFKYLNGEIFSEVVKICDSGLFQIKGRKLKLEEVARKLEKIDKVEVDDYHLKFKEMLMFPDGRTFIEAPTEEKAKSVYTKYIGN